MKTIEELESDLIEWRELALKIRCRAFRIRARRESVARLVRALPEGV